MFSKSLILCFSLMICFRQLSAQELFVYSEPASNMATKSIGFRAANNFMRQTGSNTYEYLLVPEIMVGISKKVMLHAEGFLSNMGGSFKANGGALYGKYRFYSNDEVHSHFRMAAYAKGAVNNSLIRQEAINLNGQNSGFEAGLVATKLINKIALAAGGSFVHATHNTSGNKFHYGTDSRNAVSYNVAIGKLMLPKSYTDYKQTNMNLMLEILGQTNIGTGKSFADLAPSVQFIILSQMRIDVGYRFAVVRDLQRTSNDGFLIKLEYNIFNAYK